MGAESIFEYNDWFVIIHSVRMQNNYKSYKLNNYKQAASIVFDFEHGFFFFFDYYLYLSIMISQ